MVNFSNLWKIDPVKGRLNPCEYLWRHFRVKYYLLLFPIMIRLQLNNRSIIRITALIDIIDIRIIIFQSTNRIAILLNNNLHFLQKPLNNSRSLNKILLIFSIRSECHQLFQYPSEFLYLLVAWPFRNWFNIDFLWELGVEVLEFVGMDLFGVENVYLLDYFGFEWLDFGSWSIFLQ